MFRRTLIYSLAILGTGAYAGPVLSQEQAEEKRETVLVVYYGAGGQTQRVAEMLAGQLGAQLHEIKTTAEYDPFNARADREKGVLPNIRRNLPNLRKVDRVILVFPVWGYTVALPMQKYLELADLKEKSVDAVAVSTNKLGATFDRLQDMLKGGTVQRTINVSRPKNLNDEQLAAVLGRWNTGRIPRKVYLTKGIEARKKPLLSIAVDDPLFALFLPRTTKWSNSAATRDAQTKPTDRSPGYLTIRPDSSVWFEGRRIGTANLKLPKGTFREGEEITLF